MLPDKSQSPKLLLRQFTFSKQGWDVVQKSLFSMHKDLGPFLCPVEGGSWRWMGIFNHHRLHEKLWDTLICLLLSSQFSHRNYYNLLTESLSQASPASMCQHRTQSDFSRHLSHFPSPSLKISGSNLFSLQNLGYCSPTSLTSFSSPQLPAKFPSTIKDLTIILKGIPSHLTIHFTFLPPPKASVPSFFTYSFLQAF